MALFDRQSRRVVVRIVYDGPAEAGKTTNVRRLESFFTLMKRSELFTPEEIEGRTAFFDWLQVDTGLVSGHQLRCQLLTVPGQQVLSRRRWKLLKSADAVIFVCDSRPEALAEALPMYRVLDEYSKGRDRGPLPLVIQANKQDLQGAVDAKEVHSRLGAADDAPAVASAAENGNGVRETLVLAIRAAANCVQEQILASGIDSLMGDATDAEQTLAELRAESVPTVELDVDGSTITMRPPAGEEGTPTTTPTTTTTTTTERASDSSSPPALGSISATALASLPVAACGKDTAEAAPPLPSPDVPSGYMWPAATGRDVLRRVDVKSATLRPDLTGRHGTAGGSGSHTTLVYEAGLWCLKTARTRRFRGLEEARTALIHLARRKVQLGGLLPPNTVLSLSSRDENTFWLWTVTPWLTTLRDMLTYAAKRNDESLLKKTLELYASLAIRALGMVHSSGVALDVHPSNFAVHGEQAYYIDDDIMEGEQLPTIAYSLLQRVEEFGDQRHVTDHYLASIRKHARSRLGADTVKSLQLADLMGSVVARTVPAEAASRELAHFFARFGDL